MLHSDFLRELEQLGNEGCINLVKRLLREVFGTGPNGEDYLNFPVDECLATGRYSGTWSLPLFVTDSDYDEAHVTFSRNLFYTQTNDEGRSVVSFKVSESWHPKLPNIDRILKAKLSEATTAEQQIRTVLEYIAETYRKPVSSGCVQAFIDNNKWFWVSKRPTSSNIILYNGDYYLTTVDNPWFKKVYISRTEAVIKHLDEIQNGEARNIGGVYYDKSLCVPIYTSYNASSDTLGSKMLYALKWDALERFRSYTRPNGEVIYTKEQLPYANYWKTPIHNYSSRIEEYLEEGDLFLKGSVDLYSRRKTEETPFLGWELEACCNTAVEVSKPDGVAEAMKRALPKVVICKHDGSISPTGFETVSIPATLDFWKEAPLTEALNLMRSKPYNMRSYEHSSCGFHVHVSRSALSVLDLQKLERFMHNPENNAFLREVAGRGPCNYSKYYPEVFFTSRKSNNKKKSNYAIDLVSRQDALRWLIEIPGVSTDWQYLSYLLMNYVTTSCTTRAIGPSNYNIVRNVSMGDAPQSDVPPLSDVLDLIETYLSSADGTSNATGYEPHLRAVLYKVDPSRKSIINTNDSWKCGVRKTKLPVGRINNKRACDELSSPLGKGSAGRYDVLNTKNANTIEFRLFKGTMNPESVYRYLEFVDAIVRFVPDTSATNEGITYHKFISWLTKDAFNIARYNNLIGFLVKKEYIERKNIRRRNLPEPIEQDNTNIPEPSLKIETPVITPPTTVRWFDDIPEPEESDYDTMDDNGAALGCDCDDCRAARGEI